MCERSLEMQQKGNIYYVKITSKKSSVSFSLSFINRQTAIYEEQSDRSFLVTNYNTGKEYIRFGIDDNEYILEDFLHLQEFKIGNDLTINDQGVLYHSVNVQGYVSNFFLEYENLRLELFRFIIDLKK